MSLLALKPADIVRFWSNVTTEHTDKCWLWRGRSRHEFGYGQLSVRGTSIAASRIAYQLVYGEIPDGLVVRHTCDNPPCCNPLHLITGTPQDNTKDRCIRGRTVRGEGVWHKVKITEADVMRIRATPRSEWSALAKELGISRNTIVSAAIGESWKHLPNALPRPGRYTHMTLDPEKVSYIRTCGLSDTFLAKRYGTTAAVVRLARIGETWSHVSTPPDRKRRESGGGRVRASEARLRALDSMGKP